LRVSTKLSDEPYAAAQEEAESGSQEQAPHVKSPTITLSFRF
jgi:hypothetical protein